MVIYERLIDKEFVKILVTCPLKVKTNMLIKYLAVQLTILPMGTITGKSSLRQRADAIKKYRCKNLIAVLENPSDHRNIGTVIRNINALGVEKLYVVDSRQGLPKDWQTMRGLKLLLASSASAVKWSFIKVFKSTEECIEHLNKNNFLSMVTSPHKKGKKNVILHEGDYTQKKLAIWFGNESTGISDLAIQNSIACINIEMFGIIESLNLATTSGIVLYEVTKQRRLFKKTPSK